MCVFISKQKLEGRVWGLECWEADAPQRLEKFRTASVLHRQKWSRDTVYT